MCSEEGYMSKEFWIQAYECALEDIANELDLDFSSAEAVLNEKLKNNPHYLDGYLTYD